jgi:hypothetical protein
LDEIFNRFSAIPEATCDVIRQRQRPLNDFVT